MMQTTSIQLTAEETEAWHNARALQIRITGEAAEQAKRCQGPCFIYGNDGAIVDCVDPSGTGQVLA